MPKMPNGYLDALLPDEMAAKAEDIGVNKASMSASGMFVLAVLAGSFIAFGAALSTLVSTNGETIMPYGLGRLVTGFVFSLGLILVVVGGAELFTGNNLIVMAWANKRVTTTQVIRNWTIVYLGNFVGSFGIAILMFLGGTYTFAQGGVGLSALSIANTKTGLGFGHALFLGILCNVLVCLAVWMSFSGRSTVDKVVAVVPPVTAFVALGFEHSIANMYFVTYGLLIRSLAPESFWTLVGKTSTDFPTITINDFLIVNLLPVTIGNIIGGAVLVGVVYWFVYLRGKHHSAKS